MRDLVSDVKFRSSECTPFAFTEGEAVVKTSGDYFFSGVVVSVFRKRSGAPRYVVENPAGILHIFSGGQLTRVREPTGTS